MFFLDAFSHLYKRVCSPSATATTTAAAAVITTAIAAAAAVKSMKIEEICHSLHQRYYRILTYKRIHAQTHTR